MRTTLLSTLAVCMMAGGGWLIYRYHDSSPPPVSQAEQEHRLALEYQQRFHSLSTITDWETFSRDIEKAPIHIRTRYEPYVILKKARAEFLQAEEYLFRSIDLAKTTQSGSQKTGVNPLVETYIDASFTLYRQAKEHIDVLVPLQNDDTYNFELHFTRGNIYFRILQFIAGPNELQDIFEQTAVAWEKALEAKEKDVDAQMNLELLITNQNQLLQGSRQAPGDILQRLQDPSLGRGGKRGSI